LEGEPHEVSSEIVEALPQTAMIFSVPLIHALKSGVFAFVPPEYLRMVVEVMAFAFDEDDQAFNSIVSILKKGFKDLFEKLKKTSFHSLL
jgi:hypothetical protein